MKRKKVSKKINKIQINKQVAKEMRTEIVDALCNVGRKFGLRLDEHFNIRFGESEVKACNLTFKTLDFADKQLTEQLPLIGIDAQTRLVGIGHKLCTIIGVNLRAPKNNIKIEDAYNRRYTVSSLHTMFDGHRIKE